MRPKNGTLSVVPVGACSMSDLDTLACRSSPTARCQRRKGRPPCPGNDASLSSGPGRMKPSRSSTGSRAHTPGREDECTPESRSHTHCRGEGIWRGEIRARSYRPEQLSSKNICSISLLSERSDLNKLCYKLKLLLLTLTQDSSHQVLQSMESSSLGMNSSVPLPDGMPQRHSATDTQRPSCNNCPSGHRQPEKAKNKEKIEKTHGNVCRLMGS